MTAKITPQPEKPNFEQLQKNKLIGAWEFKSLREAEIKELQDKSTALQAEFKQVQDKIAETSQQRRDAEITLQAIAQILTEMEIDPNAVLQEAFNPKPAEPQVEEPISHALEVPDGLLDIEEVLEKPVLDEAKAKAKK